ncbi:TPA: baseplate J/gp47 family protein [Salmonella enterica subsp. enterica serovar Mississippi]|nr:baseplate J/gp47 family protein [Salmonella enterica subsp. enterica serovar Mississippi]HEC9806295.1 baseplate J/gp47 family protein [Salmonella enterica subsp. enterica serovar Mississippi]HEC9824077.1 baseplate J/gp47 family protein [Salmonella enterica subsp. enterica serovar Mississippi]HEC9843126.1 baseplate J/gp47 family protein [Salmonella enterica subsp. enterica serovar Mississippi]
MSDLPISYDIAGPVPKTTDELRQLVIDTATALSPGITTNLPGSLIEDMVSTSVGALVVCDQARVDLINSCSPYAANVHLLAQLGDMYGVQKGLGTNTSVYVVFSGPPGFAIPKGFMVGDGTYTYTVQRDTMIPESGQTEPVYCLATTGGSWAVPAGTVNQIKTSVPNTYNLTCTNLIAGLPGAQEQTFSSYRAQVFQAGMYGVQGTPDCYRIELKNVYGVQENLISYRQASLGAWVAIAGGGDPYEVAYAIYKAVPDISVLTNDVVNPSGAAVDKKTIPIIVYPDTYHVPFVVPSSQNVTLLITWNTASTSYIDPTGIEKAVQQSIADYINGIATGEPINIFLIRDIFLNQVKGLVSSNLVSMIDIQVGINGKIVPPATDSSLVYGDTYAYFSTSSSQIQVKQYGSSS